MSRLRALIVDDERLARQKLRGLLAEETDLEVVGECANGEEAVEAIRRDRPDVVFLDIQMPGLSGFEVLREVGPENAGQVIFVTAYDEYAVKAFEIQALDYLLKPFDRQRLRESLERARRAGSRELQDKIAALLAELERRQDRVHRLLVKSSGRLSFVKVEEIDWLEAADNYVKLHCGRAEHLVRGTISGFEVQLDPARFVRVHRGAIVNLDAVLEVRSTFHGSYEVLLRDRTIVGVGRNHRDGLLKAMGG